MRGESWVKVYWPRQRLRVEECSVEEKAVGESECGCFVVQWLWRKQEKVESCWIKVKDATLSPPSSVESIHKYCIQPE